MVALGSPPEFGPSITLHPEGMPEIHVLASFQDAVTITTANSQLPTGGVTTLNYRLIAVNPADCQATES